MSCKKIKLVGGDGVRQIEIWGRKTDDYTRRRRLSTRRLHGAATARGWLLRLMLVIMILILNLILTRLLKWHGQRKRRRCRRKISLGLGMHPPRSRKCLNQTRVFFRGSWIFAANLPNGLLRTPL